jgi:murein DD-endopeptidase MepM/ murein hydrolase activator NlpD
MLRFLLCLALFAPPAAAAPPSATAHAAARVPGWVSPLGGPPEVVRPFDPPARPWLPGHRGVDLAGIPGAPVRSAGVGVVVFAAPLAGRGVVSIEHPSGLRTTYEPVTATVAAGDAVGPGTTIGRLDAGHPGCPVAACLHWGLRRDLTYLDPMLLLRPVRVRLKPLSG